MVINRQLDNQIGVLQNFKEYLPRVMNITRTPFSTFGSEISSQEEKDLCENLNDLWSESRINC